MMNIEDYIDEAMESGPKSTDRKKLLNRGVAEYLKSKKEAVLGIGRKSGLSLSNTAEETTIDDMSEDAKEKVTQKQMVELEKYLDKLWAKVGIDIEFTRHFVDRVNDARNADQISAAEIQKLFRKEFKKNGKKIAQLGPDAQAVMTDLSTDINVPFVLNLVGNELELVSKTIMRKKNFTTPNDKFKV